METRKMKMLLKGESSNRSKPGEGFVRRVNILFLSSFFIVALLGFLLVYQPMKAELEKSLMENFQQVSGTKYQSFQTSLLRAEEGQKSLSSRTMIKNAIADYRDGKISMEELQLYTQPKYADEARVLENLISAHRLVDGMVVGQYINPELVSEEQIPINQSGKHFLQSDFVQLTLLQDRVIGVVKSSIMEGSEILGYDILYYDFTETLRLLSSEPVQADIVDSERYQDLLLHSESVEEQEEWTTLKNGRSIIIAAPIGEDNYFVSEQGITDLFQPIHRLAIQIAVGASFSFVLYALATYLFLVRFAREELKNLEISKNRFEEIAYRDQLTGAYSRHFLDIWNRSIRSKQNYAIVMIDIDGFKKINDNHGHLVGDEILQFAGEALTRSIRHRDYLIRYGGDEFVLILMDTGMEDAHELMKRIQKELGHPKSERQPIYLSYGIAVLTETDQLEDRLREADHSMYEYKYRNQEGKRDV